MFIPELDRALKVLLREQTILYPTDTVWGIGCDATSEHAVSKIFKIKNRANSKSLVILVNSPEMLQNYIENVPEKVMAVLSKTTKPTTVIYKNPKNLAKNVIADDQTVAIRIVRDDFCESLIRKFDKPIVSTSANISGDTTPKSFKDISKPILHSVDYIVNLPAVESKNSASQIIKLNDLGEIEFLRK